MPNANYLRGRRFEYEVKQRWATKPYTALRTAGSHGAFDIVAYIPRIWHEEGNHYAKDGVSREIRRGYEYITYITPIVGYGIQCKVKKLRNKR